ncbi:MAG: hypothetical protein IJL26_12355 [Clostridia bacterium]|nr:hypothetical protein [Clostridia bacterium]
MKRRILSVFLCVALLFCTLSVLAAATDKTRYVVLGDSIAYGSGLSNPREAVYGRIVADTDGFAYENYAVPGHTTANLLHRMENETVAESIRKADIVNISIGGNNFLLGNLGGLLYDGIVKTDYTKFDEIAKGFSDDLHEIVGRLRDLNPDAAIVLQTIYNPQTSYVGDVYQNGADRINGKMFEFAEENPGEIIIADVASALTDPDTDFAEDRIHPSAAGNEKIARCILQTLYDNGLGDATEPVIAVPGTDLRGTGGFTQMVDFYGWLFHILSVIRNLFAGMRV